MGSRIKERCIYCGGDVLYDGSEPLVKCLLCGQILAVAKFENELLRIQKTEEENVLIKEQLKEAELEKQAADDRLFAALSDLGEIRDEQDTLGKVVHLLTEGQGDALQSLEFLKGVSERLLNTQNSFVARLGVVQDIAIQLQKNDMAEHERQSVMNEFMLWSQQILKEDVQRLQGIANSADELIAGQREIKNKVDELKAAADLHQKTLEEFRGQYTKDKLKKIQKLYRQAGDYQHDRRYDKAEEYYRRMLTEGEEDAEVYWRLIMCHYCVFYEKDDDGRMIPIILNPDLTDPAEMSLRKELVLQMTEQENVDYDTKLQEIDRILDKYRLLKDQVQYDIFISVKQDDNGRYTADSDVASDLYDFLTGHGLRVFNSRRTPIPAGHEYEPYIISALISAKVLIVVGTTPDNMNSNWVKNEWSRFQWLQYREKEKTGKTDRVLFCYLAKGMRAEQIPRALHPDRQAIYDGVKAHDELLMAIDFLKKTGIQTGGSGYIPTPLPKPDYGKVKKQMTAWLVIGKYEKVQKRYDELLDEGSFLEHASLHLAALCARNKVADINQILNSVFVLEDAPEYKTAVLLCDDEEEKQMLERYLAQNREWREKQNNESITPDSQVIRPAPITCNGNIVEETIQRISEKYADQPEFVSAVSEHLMSIKPAIVAKEYEYRENAVLERMLEPDREDRFDVHWVNDQGQDQVNKGYCVQFNKALGPYRGSIRLHPSVNLSMIKYLSYDLMFRNALSTLPLGGGMAGSDFSPGSKSDSEIMRFCQGFIRELCKYISDDTNLIRGNVGTGAKELGYMMEAYRKECGMSAAEKSAATHNPFAKQACGYGLLYITKALWESHGMSLKGKTASVSGSGNVAIYAIEKAHQLGVRVVTCSDSRGWIYDPAGIDVELLKEIREIRRTNLSEYADVRKSAEYHEFYANGTDALGVWQYKVDFAIPCAMQNEIGLEDAKMLADNAIVSVTEGANLPLTSDAEKYLKANGVMLLGSNAANIGSLIVSYLHEKNPSWTSGKLDNELEKIMEKLYKNISYAAEKYRIEMNGIPDYIVGADIAAFERVVEASGFH